MKYLTIAIFYTIIYNKKITHKNDDGESKYLAKITASRR